MVALSSSFLALVYVTVPLVTVAVYFTVLDGEGLAALVFLAPTELELDDDNRVIPFTLEILKSVKRKISNENINLTTFLGTVYIMLFM